MGNPLKRGRAHYNGTQVPPHRAATIIAMLCNGASANEIHKATGAHEYTIRALQFANASKIEEQKKIVADGALEAAQEGLTELRSHLGKGTLSPQQLVPIFGVCIDKAIALRADPTIHIEHSHQHLHAHISHSSYQSLLDELRAKHQPKSLPDSNTNVTNSNAS